MADYRTAVRTLKWRCARYFDNPKIDDRSAAIHLLLDLFEFMGAIGIKGRSRDLLQIVTNDATSIIEGLADDKRKILKRDPDLGKANGKLPLNRVMLREWIGTAIAIHKAFENYSSVEAACKDIRPKLWKDRAKICHNVRAPNKRGAFETALHKIHDETQSEHDKIVLQFMGYLASDGIEPDLAKVEIALWTAIRSELKKI